MNQPKKYELEWGGRKLTIETGLLAGLAGGSCRVQYGDTVILATACMGLEPKPGMSYFPLSVEYRENLYAAGKISGSRFIKREGRPSEEAILTARIIDRSIRPLFNQEIRNDIQVVSSVLSLDEDNDPDLPGLIGAVCALHLSDIPFNGSLAGASVSIDKEGKMIVNPTFTQKLEAKANLFVSNNGKEVVMIETDANEATEDEIYKAIELAIENTKPIIELLAKIKQELGKKKQVIKEPEYTEEEKKHRVDVEKQVQDFLNKELPKMYGIADKHERRDKEHQLKKDLKLIMAQEDEAYAFSLFDLLMEKEARRLVIEKGERIDGRKPDEIRPLGAMVGVLPRTHGSAIFQRGETQVMSIVTLASPGAEQILDGMEVEGKKRYMHHYNFPGFSVGEISPFRGPGRREIGHGALAEKSLVPMIPPKEEFPYTIRVVSEVLASNGSSSQASACGSTLALMDAGVPIKKPVAGIAIGLITSEDGSKHTILTDIQGVEDHAGDMDFKIAGTKDGINGIQLDIKLGGIAMDVVKEALEAAKVARIKILEVMLSVLPEVRKEMSPYAPRIEKLQIDPDKIRELIGPGGKVINGIIDETGVAIDIEDDGLVYITAEKPEAMKKALELVKGITKEILVGEVYEGEVMQIIKDRNTGSEIGAIVQLTPNHDGMVHISAIAYERVEKIEDYIKIGDKIKVKVMGVDKEKNRIELSRKALLEPPANYVPPPPRRPFAPRKRFNNYNNKN
ncbi:MAG: polyribonucleotide nucleotidyltransferase [Patescibacteria group bacterium]